MFCKETASVKYGKTAKYWTIYVNMVHMYRDFSRAARNGDLHMYVTMFTKIADYFFALLPELRKMDRQVSR